MAITKPTAAEIKAEIAAVTAESRKRLKYLRALLKVTECGEKEEVAE